jgi:hypothetical protein
MKTCKQCNRSMNQSMVDSGLAINSLGWPKEEVLSISPICGKCAHSYRVLRSKTFSADHNINAICLWVKLRNFNPSEISLAESDTAFSAWIGDETNVIQLPKVSAGGIRVPNGVIFDYMDRLERNSAGSNVAKQKVLVSA